MPCTKALWKYKLFLYIYKKYLCKQVITSLFAQSDQTQQLSCSLSLALWQPYALEYSGVPGNDSSQVQTHLPQGCLAHELRRAL